MFVRAIMERYEPMNFVLRIENVWEITYTKKQQKEKAKKKSNNYLLKAKEMKQIETSKVKVVNKQIN
jgi:PIN domain nuclease of toxin-antitoxin system